MVAPVLPGDTASIPVQGTVEQVLSIAFKSPGGWPAVEGHFKSNLAKLGYSELPAQVQQQTASQVNQVFSAMHTYTKPGSKHTVAISSIAAGLTAIGLPAGAAQDDYMLYVVKTK
jgi:hypothetical protein